MTTTIITLIGLLVYTITVAVIFRIVYKDSREEIKDCKHCHLLDESNYCMYLNKTIKNVDKINCINIIK